MFPTRSLLIHVECPDYQDGGCLRPSCPFSHSKRREKIQEEEEERPSNLKRKASITSITDTGPSSPKRPVNSELKGLLSQLSAGPRNAYKANKERPKEEDKLSPLKTAIPSSSSSTSLSPAPTRKVEGKPQPSKVASASSSQTTLYSHTLGQPPTISRTSHPGSSPVPFSSRQTSLQTFFSAFTKLYSPLEPPPVTDSKRTKVNGRVEQLLRRLVHHHASQDALASEIKIFKNSNVNFLAYRNSIRTSLVGLNRRQKVDSELEEKEEEGSVHMLGIQVSQAALRLDHKLAMDSVAEAERDQIIEEETTKMLKESGLFGTADGVEQIKKVKQERIKGKLTRGRLQEADLVTDRSLLQSVGYPIPDLENGRDSLQESIEESWGVGGREPNQEGCTKECDRCGTPFQVTKPESNDKAAKEACSYHWGKKRYVRQGNVAKGPRLPRWTCCDALDEATTFASNSLSQIAVSAGLTESNQSGQPSAPRGCCFGPHVFKEETAELLHQREGFLCSEEICSEEKEPDKEKHDVLAFDCELVYTTAGMSLARLTVLDEAGKVILDQLVRPRSAVLDYNTRFSGIKEQDLEVEENVVDVAKAREKMCDLMTPSTILVGHGLENDLKAIRLVHLQVADSALIYKHHKGLPFRFSLRDLTLKHLGKQIQVGDANFGHDPEEDARAALDLVRRQYLEIADKLTSVESSAKSASVDKPSSVSVTTHKPSNPFTAASSNPLHLARSSTSSGPSAAAKASLFIKKREPIRKKSSTQ